MTQRESTTTDHFASSSEADGEGSGGTPAGRSVIRPAPWALRIGVPIALVVLILLAFMPGLGAGFVDWDDDDLLIHNTRYQGFGGESLAWMWTTSYSGHFQPLTWLSYAVDHAIWGGLPFGYHLTNVVFHILTALSFYLVARLLLVIAVGDRSAVLSKPVILSAAFAAAFFAVHPLRVESVVWIAERRDVLSGFLFVAAVGCYLRYAWSPVNIGGEAAAPPGPASWSRRLYYTAAVLLGVLSLLAKAVAITLPFVLLILDIYPLRRLSGRRQPAKTGGPWVFIDKIPFLVLAVWAGKRALTAQDEGGALYGLAEHDFIARSAQAVYGLAFYIWKTVLPTGLGPLYSIPQREVLLGGMFWGALIVVVVLAVIAVRSQRRWPAIPAALAVYVIILAPVLGFAQSGPQLVADRYSYLACMGFALLAAAWLLRALRRDSWWSRLSGLQGRLLLGLLAAVIVTTLERATYQQAELWESARTLWKRGVQISPDSAVANANYADALASLPGAAARRRAATHYQKALEINPDDVVALHHYGDLLRDLGETDAAIRHYLRALQIDPNRLRACYWLARLFVDAGRPDLAVAALQDGIEREPKALYLIDYLARLLASHPDEHVRNGDAALEWATHLNNIHQNKHVPTLLTIATALAEVGRFEEAISTIERAMVLAEEEESDLYLARLRIRLELFREGKPFHQGP